MKKIIMIMAAVLALSTNCTVAQAQSADSQYSQLLAKQLKKQYKNKLKELKKETWQIYGSSRTLEVALLSHYDKLAKGGEDAHEIIGTATKFKSKNIGHQTAINNACNIYARQAGSHVKGRVVSDMGANSDSIVNEFDHFYGAYQSLVEKEIKGEMQESFSLIRPYKDGSFEMQAGWHALGEPWKEDVRPRDVHDARRAPGASGCFVARSKRRRFRGLRF